MSPASFADGLAGVLMVTGATLSLIAGIGVLRFPDVLTRMHSATKLQVLGLILVLTGLAFRLRDPSTLAVLALVVLFQMLTVPIGSHMIGRATVRTGQFKRDHLVVDELAESLPEEPRGAP